MNEKVLLCKSTQTSHLHVGGCLQASFHHGDTDARVFKLAQVVGTRQKDCWFHEEDQAVVLMCEWRSEESDASSDLPRYSLPEKAVFSTSEEERVCFYCLFFFKTKRYEVPLPNMFRHCRVHGRDRQLMLPRVAGVTRWLCDLSHWLRPPLPGGRWRRESAVCAGRKAPSSPFRVSRRPRLET